MAISAAVEAAEETGAQPTEDKELPGGGSGREFIWKLLESWKRLRLPAMTKNTRRFVLAFGLTLGGVLLIVAAAGIYRWGYNGAIAEKGTYDAGFAAAMAERGTYQEGYDAAIAEKGTYDDGYDEFDDDDDEMDDDEDDDMDDDEDDEDDEDDDDYVPRRSRRRRMPQCAAAWRSAIRSPPLAVSLAVLLQSRTIPLFWRPVLTV